MSLTKTQPRTAAELSLIDRAEGRGIDSTAREALDVLRAEGLPSRRVEAWHYTDLRALLGRLKQDDAPATASQPSYLSPLLPHSVVVELDRATAGNDLVAGLTLSEGRTKAGWSQTVNHLDRGFDTIRVLNQAMGARGLDIAIAPDLALSSPVELRPEPSAVGGQSFANVSIGAGSKATIVERAPAAGAGAISTAVYTLDIADGADLLWIVVQEKGADESHLGQLNVTLHANSQLRLFVLNAGGAVVRQEVHAVTEGEGADIKIRGVNLLQDGQHVDVTTTLNHNVAHTTSTETFRNVVLGGHGVFQGMIRVAKGAQKTDARLACNTLLLSDEGDFSAKPELEIFADDVQCGHGATAGEINADHLFYLMSRGIPEARARSLLVKAFVGEVVEELEEESVVEALEARIDAWLDSRH
ncbi:Fe-S cluster assembly protein SufD [Aureimonas ureilytica]|uniref:Fe-S cluster assembly protein SufD n=1 Tax=Aureimonas ureilytica TaxID=401562 RepID=UPI000381CB83|nr:Fe-S cluster assembly protein SufD [Aureimonas ureilytica]